MHVSRAMQIDGKDRRRIFVRDNVIPEKRQKVERPCDSDVLDSFLLQVSQPLPHLVVLLVYFTEYEVVHKITNAMMKRLEWIDTVFHSTIF